MISYGSIRLTGNQWSVRCEPHVRAKLKRVFPKAFQGVTEEISLVASPETSRELEWFLVRYPMDVENLDELTARAERHRISEKRVAALLEGYMPPSGVVLAHPPREYQTVVPHFLAVRKGLLLADQVGLGKTVSSIICMVTPGYLPAVVVAPPHLCRQWSREIKKFAPRLTTHVIKKGQVYDLAPKRRKKAVDDAQPELLPDEMFLPDVVIISYHKLRGWAEHLKGRVRFVVFDECQQLRRKGTQIYDACTMAADGAAVLGLSATPIYNYGGEYWNVMNVLIPDALGSWEEFTREWCTTDNAGNYRLNEPKEFGAFVRREGLMLDRTRKDVGRELPHLTKIVHEIDADPKALDAMASDAVKLAQVMLQHNQQFKGEKMQAAGEFDALMRQATGVAKAPYVAEFVRLLLENGEPVVLYGWHRAVYDIWMEKLKDFSPALYTGSESATQKDEARNRFLSGETNLIIISLRSGAGLDGLQYRAKVGVFGELDWSPGVHEQCMGRYDRDGQPDPTTAYFLVSDFGADPIMSEVLGIKREQIEGVRNPSMVLTQRIDNGENTLRRLAQDFLARRGVAVEALPAGGQNEAAGEPQEATHA